MAIGPASNSLEKYKTAVVLRDGSTLHLRPIRRDDEDRLLALFYRLSRHTVYLRFHKESFLYLPGRLMEKWSQVAEIRIR